jgi:hypothetical protein
MRAKKWMRKKKSYIEVFNIVDLIDLKSFGADGKKWQMSIYIGKKDKLWVFGDARREEMMKDIPLCWGLENEFRMIRKTWAKWGILNHSKTVNMATLHKNAVRLVMDNINLETPEQIAGLRHSFYDTAMTPIFQGLEAIINLQQALELREEGILDIKISFED